MNSEQLQDLIKRAESEDLAFVDPQLKSYQLARVIGSLANSNGGRIVFGVADRQKVVGVDIEKIQQLISQSKHDLSSEVDIEVSTYRIGSKDILIAKVSQVGVAVTANGCYFMREGEQVRSYHTDEDVSSVSDDKHAQAILKLSDSVTTQTALIERLTKELEVLSADFRTANSPKRKLTIGLLGAIVGVLLRYVAGFVIK